MNAKASPGTDDEKKAALARVLRAIAPVPDAAIARLAAVTVRRTFAPGEWLLRGGERAETCFLLVRGLVRELYVGSDGAEHTRAFMTEGTVTGSLLDLLSGEPSITFIQALEPTIALAFPYAHFDAVCMQYTELMLVARRSAEALYLKKARREHDMLALTAKERYAAFSKEHPALALRIKQRHLASYLGVTPEHLSRLRAARSRDAGAPRRRSTPRGRATPRSK
jgi:CRP-like cAMP-binding protein